MTRRPYHFRRTGRNPRTIIGVITVFGCLIAGHMILDVSRWILITLSIVTIPALWDIISNRQSGLSIAGNRLQWWSGTRHCEIDCTDIDHMRFDTRFDFSIRVSAVTCHNQSIRLPYDALPNHSLLEKACHEHGLRTERHHFTVLS